MCIIAASKSNRYIERVSDMLYSGSDQLLYVPFEYSLLAVGCEKVILSSLPAMLATVCGILSLALIPAIRVIFVEAEILAVLVATTEEFERHKIWDVGRMNCRFEFVFEAFGLSFHGDVLSKRVI